MPMGCIGGNGEEPHGKWAATSANVQNCLAIFVEQKVCKDHLEASREADEAETSGSK
jgi:hypothetical protein